MENQKPIKNQSRRVAKAAIWGAMLFGVVTLFIIFGGEVHHSLSLVYLVAAPSIVFNGLFPFDIGDGIVIGALFETFVNAMLGGIVFGGWTFLGRLLTSKP